MPDVDRCEGLVAELPGGVAPGAVVTPGVPVVGLDSAELPGAACGGSALGAGLVARGAVAPGAADGAEPRAPEPEAPEPPLPDPPPPDCASATLVATANVRPTTTAAVIHVRSLGMRVSALRICKDNRRQQHEYRLVPRSAAALAQNASLDEAVSRAPSI